MFQKFRLYAIATLAMLCLSTLFIHPSFAQVGSTDLTMLSTLNPVILTTTASADQTDQPVVKTSWGNLKRLYYDRGQVSTSPAPAAIIKQPGVGPMWLAYTGPDWSNNVKSEAFYTLDIYRGGSSLCVYQGMAMSDWVQRFGYTYPRSDGSALDIVSRYIGAGNVGNIDGTWNGCPALGGYCKFFVDLVLYRSSYGIGSGWHLVLPPGTDPSNFTPYMPGHDVHEAQAGWVLQRGGSTPHTALVAANLGSGLDLIDSNNVAYNGSFVIARHYFTWAQLSAYTAFHPTYMRQVVNGSLQ